MTRTLQAEDFEKQLNQPVRFSREDVDFEATISLVDRYEQKSLGERENFAVVFCTGTSEVRSQQTYTMEHPEIGTHHVFIVPIGPDDNGMRYEAVFS